MHKLSRRQFLRQAGCTGMGAATLLSSLNNLSMLNKLVGFQSAPPGDYKALVCLLLAGGNDSYNMLVPRGPSEYAEYAGTRSDLALPQNELLAVNPLTSDGKSYGIHPSMSGVRNLFENEKLAFVANVGTLIEPVPDATAYFSGLKKIPLGLYSHADQIQQWQTAIPHTREAVGWAGRAADLLKTLNTNQNFSMNISLSGRNVWQSGNTVLEYSISNQGNGVQGISPIVPSWYSNAGFLSRLQSAAIQDLSTFQYANIFKDTFGELTSQSVEAFEALESAISAVQVNSPFSTHHLSQNLKMIARVIGARNALGMRRQTFFVTYGGWDHHDEVIENQEYMLGVVSAAVSEFMTALTELGVENDVTLFTISDFARTLTSNGNGSDHAWGGHTFVAGGAVQGREIYGTYPDLHLSGNPLVVSNRGNLIPTTSADQYFAEMALWFGVAPSDLSTILPNIGYFYDVSSGTSPLGFLG
ncbi:MAG: hypothetical protein RLY31_3167 [Bacteroidota bacterium]|jgi:uncharacterized protein (DUF1501 family)